MSERRRAAMNAQMVATSLVRPSSEESQYWASASSALSSFLKVREPQGAVGQLLTLNRLIAQIPDPSPSDDIHDYDAPDLRQFAKGGRAEIDPKTREAFLSTLQTVKNSAEEEVKSIDMALEHLEVLIALRRAPPEVPPPQDKRNKRIRISSPAMTPTPSRRASPGPPASLMMSAPSHSRGAPNASPKYQHQQYPPPMMASSNVILPGRKVAFAHPAANPGEGEWILAIVKTISGNHYIVVDADESAPAEYATTLASLIPLPDPFAPPHSPTSISAYPEYPPGKPVLAVYEGTTVFYHARVVAGPKAFTGGKPIHGTNKPELSYKVKFEDDNDEVRLIPAHLVVAAPVM